VSLLIGDKIALEAPPVLTARSIRVYPYLRARVNAVYAIIPLYSCDTSEHTTFACQFSSAEASFSESECQRLRPLCE
jgi:hypothetical protein